MRKSFDGYLYAKKLIDATIYTLIAWVALFLIIYSSAVVYDVSMQPTLNAKSGVADNDIVYYNKLADAKVGDIVIIQTSKDEMIVKRMIAKAKDRVRYEYNDGVYNLYINDLLIQEDYIKEPITIERIEDSDKTLNYVDLTDLSGYNPLAQLKKFQPNNFDSNGNYVVPDGQIFALGDNRIYSTDSKTHGGYDVSSVVGVVDLIIHSDENTFLKLIEFLF